MQRRTDKEELSLQQKNKKMNWKAVKTKNNSKIRQADETDTHLIIDLNF